MDALSNLIARWSTQKVGLLPPEPEFAIKHTFASIGGHATTEILALYTKIGGMSEMDAEYWRLWSLKEIEEENAAPSAYGVLFSDYLIYCWSFRLRALDGGRTEVYLDLFDNTAPRLVAESLSEFFVTYVRNPDDVLLP